MTLEQDDLVKRLARLETGQVSDVLDEAGFPNQVLDSRLAPLMPGSRLAGRAACARGEKLMTTATAEPESLPGDILERLARRQAIIVIASGGFTAGSCLGGFVALSLKREGCRGVIVDAPVRDAEEIRAASLPVFCTSVNPVNGSRRWRLREADVPVFLPGLDGVDVRISPEDFILADADGIVVVPAAIAQAIIEDSEELQRIESAIGAAMRAGASRTEAFRANPRFGHIRRHDRR
jgi:4-hydroxy-4-methyl-2-oxoglutarate aldolase